MIILFDLDSTLVTLEGMDEVAKKKGLGENIRLITEKTMCGAISFEEAFPSKVDTLAPSVSELEWLGQVYIDNPVPNLIKVFNELISRGIKLGIVTGNFEIAVNVLSNHLNFSEELRFFNKIQFNSKGRYKGFDADQILSKDDGKAQTVKALKSKYSKEKIYFVGDSVGDMTTQGVADKFIGFGGVVVRDKVKSQAEHFIYDMKELIHLV